MCSYPQLCFVLLAKSLKLLEDRFVHLQSGCGNSKLPVVRFNYDKVFASALKTIKHRGKIQTAIITTIDLCFYIQHSNLPVMGLFAYLSDQAFCLISHAYYRTHFSHPGGGLCCLLRVLCWSVHLLKMIPSVISPLNGRVKTEHRVLKPSTVLDTCWIFCESSGCLGGG